MLLLLPARIIRTAMRPRKPDGRKPRSPSPNRPGRPGGRAEGRQRFSDDRPDRTGRQEKRADRHAGKHPPRPNRDDSRRDDSRREDRPPRPEARGERGRRDERGPRPHPGARDREQQDHGRGPSRPAPTRPAPDRPTPDQRRRDRSGHRPDLPVWLYGSHACLAALGNPERSFRRLLLTREAREALQDQLPANPQPEIVDRLRLESLLPPGAVHQGIALLVDPLDDGGIEGLREELAEGRDIVLLLDHVTDPRNIGAILRSAAAFGARAVVVTDRHAPEATGALAKAASGALEIVPLIRVTNLARALDQLAEYGYWRVGLEMESDKTLAEAVRDIRRTALVLGAEDEGLRRLTREKCDFLAKLPMSGAIESLNVSAAAAVALYECVRG